MSEHLRVDRHGDFLVVHFLDKDIHTEFAVGSVGDELYGIIARPDCSKLVLNFSGVEFLCSAMLGKLISAKRMMAQKGGLLRLCEVCPDIRLMFRYTRLDHIFDIPQTETEALQL